jgi:hypothetical protein
MSSWTDNGLDLSNPDEVTPEEWEAFRRSHGEASGYPEGHPVYRFWMEAGRPDIVKRNRTILQVVEPSVGTESPGWRTRHGGLPTALANLHLYILNRFTSGVVYECVLAQKHHYAKEQVLDVFALASIHSAAASFVDLHDNAELRELFATWPETDEGPKLPAGWDYDLASLRAGLDYSVPDLGAEELDRLYGWYRRYLGEIPEWVSFAAEHNPRLLKQFRARWEGAVKALPRQFVPFCQLVYYGVTRNEAGIRECVLLGRGLGMSRDQIVATACVAAQTYGGPTALAAFSSAAGDLLASWPAGPGAEGGSP